MAEERQIQKELYLKLRPSHLYTIPNIYRYDWESDILSITKSNMAIEYEIKVSVQDYKKDFTHKKEKHEVLKNGWRKAKNEREKRWRGEIIKSSRPNRFYYLVPSEMINEWDIPEYAGLLWYISKGKYTRIKVMKKAPLLHKEKIDNDFIYNCLRGMYYKYWNNLT